MRALGLDVGSKTIGVAASDELGWTAQAVITVRRTNLRADLAQLKQLVTDRGIDHLIVGLPLNMDGSEGPSAQEARKVGDALAEQVPLTVIYWDERLSTVAAQRALLEGNASRKKRKEVIDQVAAAFILQGWLDSRSRSEDE
jgi:putative Holliday junction resolvase